MSCVPHGEPPHTCYVTSTKVTCHRWVGEQASGLIHHTVPCLGSRGPEEPVPSTRASPAALATVTWGVDARDKTTSVLNLNWSRNLGFGGSLGINGCSSHGDCLRGDNAWQGEGESSVEVVDASKNSDLWPCAGLSETHYLRYSDGGQELRQSVHRIVGWI